MSAPVIDRKAIRAALLGRLQEFLPQVRLWLDHPVPDGVLAVKPAAALYSTSQGNDAQDGGAPPEWRLGLTLEVHVEGQATDDQLDDAIGGVEKALQLQNDETVAIPGSEYVTSLDGLVAGARISGEIDFFSIRETGSAMAEIPLEVLTRPAT